jgi:transcriptional regulator with XRE-family HTH domain
MSINDKIKQVLTMKNLSPSYLADDIGVQRSSISHILSGRNRPSLDIIQKIVRRFPEFTYEWFLESDLQLSTDPGMIETVEPSLKQPVGRPSVPTTTPRSAITTQSNAQLLSGADQNETIVPKQNTVPKPGVDRILIFYTDGTFREYTPASSL